MCWRSSPDRERPMVRLKRSTAGLNICAGLLWGSVTSPTTSPGVCSSPVASDRFYTLNYDEPYKAELIDRKVWSGLIEVMAETSKWVAWYNPTRLHSAIDYRPPIEVHSEWTNQSATEPAAA